MPKQGKWLKNNDGTDDAALIMSCEQLGGEMSKEVKMSKGEKDKIGLDNRLLEAYVNAYVDVNYLNAINSMSLLQDKVPV